MKIISETLKQNVEINDLPNQSYSRIEINEKLKNIRLEFNEDERQQLLEILLEGSLKCTKCMEDIDIDYDTIYCENCYDRKR